jgi:hypothetical protein
MKTVLLMIVLLTAILSCSKNSSEKDSVPPVITLTSPTNGQLYTAGDVVLITGTITDDKYIAEVHIHISNAGTGALLKDIHLYPNGNTSTLNQFIDASAGVSYKIQVIAKDRGVNEVRSTVEVTCN